MDYTLKEISEKMGLPEFPEKKEMLYYYHNPENSKLGGYAEIQLEDSDRLLTASLYHCRGDYHDDNGVLHSKHEETVQINACRMGGTDIFRVVHMVLDGTEYSPTDNAMVELGLAVLHSRIVDINLGMVEQTFENVNGKAVNKVGSDRSDFIKSKTENTKENKVVKFPKNTNPLTV